MITQENLLWLRDTPLGEFNSLMTAVTKDMTESERQRFLDRLWEDVALMRHLRGQAKAVSNVGQ